MTTDVDESSKSLEDAKGTQLCDNSTVADKQVLSIEHSKYD